MEFFPIKVSSDDNLTCGTCSSITLHIGHWLTLKYFIKFLLAQKCADASMS